MKIPFPPPGATVTKNNEADHGHRLYAAHLAYSDPNPHLADKRGIDERTMEMKA